MIDKLIDVLSNPLSYGKFNCIIKYDNSREKLLLIYENVIELFNPNEIYKSLFNLNTSQMENFDSIESFKEDNCIRQIIFQKEKEQIIINYFKGSFLVEHNFWFHDGISEFNNKVIKEIFLNGASLFLILGFELSIHIDKFDNSLIEHKMDKSLHPIIIISKINNDIKTKEYFSNDNYIDKHKMEILNKYLNEISII